MTEKREPDSFSPSGSGGTNATNAEVTPSNSDNTSSQQTWNSGHPGGVPEAAPDAANQDNSSAAHQTQEDRGQLKWN